MSWAPPIDRVSADIGGWLALDRAFPALMAQEIDPASREGLGDVPLVWRPWSATSGIPTTPNAWCARSTSSSAGYTCG